MLTNLHDYARPGSDSERIFLASLIQADFSQCYPGQTLDDVKRRAPFSRHDQGLLREWMKLAAIRAAAVQAESSLREKAKRVA